MPDFPTSAIRFTAEEEKAMRERRKDLPSGESLLETA